MKNFCLVLTSGVVCAFIIYYSWSLYKEVETLKTTLATIETDLQTSSSQSPLEMHITESQEQMNDKNSDSITEFNANDYHEETEEEGEELVEESVETEEEQEEGEELVEESVETGEELVEELVEESVETEEEEGKELVEEPGQNLVHELVQEFDASDSEPEQEENASEEDSNSDSDNDSDLDEAVEEAVEELDEQLFVSIVSDKKTKNELIRLLKEQNLSVYGNKEVLIRRIMTLDNFQDILNINNSRY